MDPSPILHAVYAAIDEFNESRASDERLAKALTTALYGDAGPLSSLDLVHLIVAVEEAIDDALDAEVTLSDAKALSTANSPFRDVGSLVQFVETRLAGA